MKQRIPFARLLTLPPFLILPFILVVGCVVGAAGSRAHLVECVGGFTCDPLLLFDNFDWQHLGPREFLELPKTRDHYSVEGVHVGWVKQEDLPHLIDQLDSAEKCGAVKMTISSYIEGAGSTVGQEAAFLIEGFRQGQYPSSLNSTRPAVDRGEIRRWWENVRRTSH